MRLYLKTSDLFLVPGNQHMLHLGPVGYGLREFIVMHCLRGPHKGNTYIEEVVLNSVDWTADVFAHCKFVEETALAEDLANFAEENKLLDVKERFHQLQDQGRGQWLFGKQTDSAK